MKNIVQILKNPENILSYGLGFVVAWFGVHEVFSPQDWIAFAPPFLGDGRLAAGLVVLHGIVLISCALLLFFGIYRRVATVILSLIFLEIIITLITQNGLSDIAVRDIGLCAMAISIAVSGFRK